MTPTDAPRRARREGIFAVILHRDGTVTLWSCRRRRWERGYPSMSAIEENDRETASRILDHLARHGRHGHRVSR
jgi:hypothetical protein